jgi:hypothetical protein
MSGLNTISLQFIKKKVDHLADLARLSSLNYRGKNLTFYGKNLNFCGTLRS